MVLNPERLHATATASLFRHIGVKLQILLLAAACALVAPEMMAQNQPDGTATGHTRVTAPRHTQRLSAKSTPDQQRSPASISNAQKDTQALLDDERAAVA